MAKDFERAPRKMKTSLLQTVGITVKIVLKIKNYVGEIIQKYTDLQVK